MRILLAGGLGLVGTATARALASAGHTVVVASRSATAASGYPAVSVDLGLPITDLDALGDMDAIVNAVGIATEVGANTFERAHVDATRNLVAFAKAKGIQRFVHISVVAVSAAKSAYHETKRRGEAVVRASGLAWTILRPGLIYGPGDDMLSNLVEFVRAAPVFIVPADAGPLQVVDVEDVADAVVRALGPAQSAATGATIDIVGPVRYRLRELVTEVASTLALPTVIVPVPTSLLGAAVAVLQRFMREPPLTRTQLEMLALGLAGDPGPARSVLGLQARRLSPQTIARVADVVRPRFPSVRLAPSADHRALLEQAARAPQLAWFLPLTLALLLALPFVLPNIWLRMGAINLVLTIAAVRWVELPWTSLAAPTVRRVVAGLASAGVMGAAAVAVIGGLSLIAPQWMDQAGQVYGWAADQAWPVTLLLIAVIAALEDVVWRFAIGLPLCGRLGPVLGSLACGGLFALAHATSGPALLLLAAFLAGTAWTAIAVRSRSFVTTATAHVLWDLGMLWLAPGQL